MTINDLQLCLLLLTTVYVYIKVHDHIELWKHADHQKCYSQQITVGDQGLVCKYFGHASIHSHQHHNTCMNVMHECEYENNIQKTAKLCDTRLADNSFCILDFPNGTVCSDLCHKNILSKDKMVNTQMSGAESDAIADTVAGSIAGTMANTLPRKNMSTVLTAVSHKTTLLQNQNQEPLLNQKQKHDQAQEPNQKLKQKLKQQRRNQGHQGHQGHQGQGPKARMQKERERTKNQLPQLGTILDRTEFDLISHKMSVTVGSKEKITEGIYTFLYTLLLFNLVLSIFCALYRVSESKCKSRQELLNSSDHVLWFSTFLVLFMYVFYLIYVSTSILPKKMDVPAYIHFEKGSTYILLINIIMTLMLLPLLKIFQAVWYYPGSALTRTIYRTRKTKTVATELGAFKEYGSIGDSHSYYRPRSSSLLVALSTPSTPSASSKKNVSSFYSMILPFFFAFFLYPFINSLYFAVLPALVWLASSALCNGAYNSRTLSPLNTPLHLSLLSSLDVNEEKSGMQLTDFEDLVNIKPTVQCSDISVSAFPFNSMASTSHASSNCASASTTFTTSKASVASVASTNSMGCVHLKYANNDNDTSGAEDQPLLKSQFISKKRSQIETATATPSGAAGSPSRVIPGVVASVVSAVYVPIKATTPFTESCIINSMVGQTEDHNSRVIHERNLSMIYEHKCETLDPTSKNTKETPICGNEIERGFGTTIIYALSIDNKRNSKTLNTLAKN